MFKYDIPPRLKRKKGLFGTFETVDVLMTGLLGAIGLILTFVIGNVLGLLMLLIFGGGGAALFLMPYKFNMNGRTWLKHIMAFSKSQKIYYFVRGTH